ncbi:glycine--tRNA ligase, mitochondrial 1-like [Curcuma longa]|uniref:glycine--tRNA ligase, mitochondrial 1-like n=1 Tax=Curcuma longa TaxID=136217 RepID=UPI003D9F8611
MGSEPEVSGICFEIPDITISLEKSGVPLVAHENFSKPREIEKLVIVPSKKELGLSFKGNQKMVVEALEAMNEKEALEMKASLESKDNILFEHSFYTRPSKSEDEQLNVFRFPPLVAPIKCTVFPLIKTAKFDDVGKIIAKSLTAARISHIIDITGTSIGKRYARIDEIGVPFAVTVDSTDSVTNGQQLQCHKFGLELIRPNEEMLFLKDAIENTVA